MKLTAERFVFYFDMQQSVEKKDHTLLCGS